MTRGVLAALMCLLLVAPLAGAQDSLEWYVEPVTEEAEQVESLFNLVSVLALIVLVGVEGALFYTVWRFRKNRIRTADNPETLRGHTKMEIAWTVVPAIVLIFIGVLSVQTLTALDTVPEDADFTVNVTAMQFGWMYEYPDGSTTVGDLLVREGETVRLNITSRDVIHAVWIPQFALKIDAVPGRTNVQWFHAPEAGEYFLQCAEYCGAGHHAMWGKVVVFPAEGNETRAYGKEGAGTAVDPLANMTNVIELETWDEGNNFWFMFPEGSERNPVIEVPAGEEVAIRITQKGQIVHNIATDAPGEKVASDFVSSAGDTAHIIFTAPSEPGDYQYWCDPHRGAGMVGTLRVV